MFPRRQQHLNCRFISTILFNFLADLIFCWSGPILHWHIIARSLSLCAYHSTTILSGKRINNPIYAKVLRRRQRRRHRPAATTRSENIWQFAPCCQSSKHSNVHTNTHAHIYTPNAFITFLEKVYDMTVFIYRNFTFTEDAEHSIDFHLNEANMWTHMRCGEQRSDRNGRLRKTPCGKIPLSASDAFSLLLTKWLYGFSDKK